MLHTLRFSLKNVVYFIMLPFLVPVLFTFYIQVCKNLNVKLGCQKVELHNVRILAATISIRNLIWFRIWEYGNLVQSNNPNMLITSNLRGVSKKFGEWSDISKAIWARCARMHMAIQRYIEKRHEAQSTRDCRGKLAVGSRT
jgi:hypothetical protein